MLDAVSRLLRGLASCRRQGQRSLLEENDAFGSCSSDAGRALGRVLPTPLHGQMADDMPLIGTLGSRHEGELRSFLEESSASAMFLLGLLNGSGLGDRLAGRFVGALGDHGEGLRATAFIGASGLCVPESRDPQAMQALAAALSRLGGRIGVIVGPREACDQLWGALHQPHQDPAPSLWRDHRLFTMEPADWVPGREEAGLRRAIPADFDELLESSAAMRREELGEDILRTNPVGFRRRVRARIEEGVSWVVRDDYGIAFKADVGSPCPQGCQIEGVYTRPDRRGQQLATRSLRSMTRQLLDDYPLVTLHVWEGNRSAVACYQRVGFCSAAPFRVIVR